MKFSSKRTISRLVAVAMLVSSVFSNVIVANADDATVTNDAVESSTAAYIPDSAAEFNEGDAVYSDDAVDITAAQYIYGGLVETSADLALIADAGKSYSTYITTSSVNTSLTVPGATKPSSYRLMFKVTAKQDATVTFDSKIAKNGKQNAVLGNVAITGTTDAGAPAGTADILASQDSIDATTDGFSSLTVDVKAGDVIYFAGRGTNTQLYAIDVVANGGSTPVDPDPTTETTTAEAPAEPEVYIPDSAAEFNADDLVYSNDTIDINAAQAIYGGLVETSADLALIADAGKSYSTYITTSSVNTSLTVPGAEKPSSYRLMFKVTAKQDATVTFDSKIAKNGKQNAVLGNVVITGTTDAGAPAGTADILASQDSIDATTDGFSSLTVDLKAGDVIYFAGRGTNTQLYAVSSVAAGGSTPVDPDPTTETTTAEAPAEPEVYIPDSAAEFNADDLVYSNDTIDINAAQAIYGGLVETSADLALIADAGKSYSTYITTSSVNTSLTVPGAEKPSSYRLMFKVTAKKDATVTFDSKIAKNGKQNAVLGNVVITGTTDAGAPAGTADVLASQDSIDATTDGFSSLTVDLKAGDVIYFAGRGTNTQLYAVSSVAAGGSTPVDPVDNSTTTTEETTETTTTAPVGDNDVVVNVNATYDEAAKTVVAEYVLSENSADKGFNNYTVKLAYDKAVLAPVSVAQGNITLAAKDALGNDVNVNASKALDTIVDDTVAYCIFDDGNAAPGSLPEFTTDGTLFVVTYNVIANGTTAVGADFSTINTVSSDDTIVSHLNAVVNAAEVVINGSTPIDPDETTTDDTTETTTDAATETTTEETPEETTLVASYVGEKTVEADKFFEAVNKTAGIPRGEFAIDDGIATINKMSQWDAKTSTGGYKFTNNAVPGEVYTGEFERIYYNGFQIGSGNEVMSAEFQVGENAFADGGYVEKGLLINAGAAGTATLYATIGSSSVESAVLYLLAKDGTVVDIQTANKVVESFGTDEEGNPVTNYVANAGKPVTFNVPEAGEYYILCPGKQTSLNFMAIDLAFGVEKPSETTTEAPTETTTAEDTTKAPIEPSTSATPSQSTTETPVETTTRVRQTGGGGGGGSVVVKTTTTEATTEAATTDGTDKNEGTSKPSVITKDVEVTIGIKGVVIGGESYEVDVAPYIQAASNSTLVPLRVVSLAILGGNLAAADSSSVVLWDGATKTATILAGDSVIAFTAGSEVMVVDGKNMVMDNGVKAEIKDSRMYVPFRALGKALDVTVEWDADTKTAKYIAPTVATTEETTEETTEAVDEETTEETTDEDSTEETTVEGSTETTTVVEE